MSAEATRTHPTAVLLRDVSAWYGSVQALFDVDLEVRSGLTTALVGTNGAGKTTLIRAILGLVRTHGQVLIAGRDYGKSRCFRRVRAEGIAVVHEGRGLIYDMSVLDNVRVSGGKGSSAQVEEALSGFPTLKGRWHDKVGLLSGGEQQMVAIARIMAGNPRLVLLDEPGLGLAPRLVDEVYRYLLELRQAKEVTVILVEQSLDRAVGFADAFIVVRAGRVVGTFSKGMDGLRATLEKEVLG